MSLLILFICIAEIRAALAKLLIEVTQQLIQCSNTTHYTNCLTFSRITTPGIICLLLEPKIQTSWILLVTFN